MITGFLHPGEMGSSVAAACAGRRIWASENRSEATVARAEAAGIEDVGDVRTLVEIADTIVSVCPPEAALAQARQVAELGFTGVYVDANAVSPATARRVASMFENAVDGGIVGPPAVTPGTTRLYLSGSHAADVARRWEGSALDARVVGAEPGAASALKMCYAAWTKGTAALLLAVLAVATVEGVDGRSHRGMGHLTTRPPEARGSCGSGQHTEGVALRRRDGRDRGDVPRRRTAVRIPCRRGGGVPPPGRLQGRRVAIARPT